MGNRPKRYNRKEFEKILKDNGYGVVRTPGGSHTIWGKGKDRISINSNLNAMVAMRLIKEHELHVR